MYCVAFGATDPVATTKVDGFATEQVGHALGILLGVSSENPHEPFAYVHIFVVPLDTKKEVPEADAIQFAVPDALMETHVPSGCEEGKVTISVPAEQVTSKSWFMLLGASVWSVV